jgi:hypothetical protein
MRKHHVAPTGCIDRETPAWLTLGVKSIYETRRENLRAIIEEVFRGDRTAFAQAVGFDTPNFVSRLLSKSEKNLKNIGPKLARKIEAAASRPENWLDIEHTAKRSTPGAIALSTGDGKTVEILPMQDTLLRLFRGLSEQRQNTLIGTAHRLWEEEHQGASPESPFPAKPRVPQDN